MQFNLPTFDAKVIEKDGQRRIYDPIRRKYVVLTPEELVRQHFVHYLITQKSFPKELIANEVSIKLNRVSKRCDTVVYDSFLTPKMIIEYKAPSVPIIEGVFNQIIRYNMTLHVPYLVISNGVEHYCIKVDYEKGTYVFQEEIPIYEIITA